MSGQPIVTCWRILVDEFEFWMLVLFTLVLIWISVVFGGPVFLELWQT